jgi:hypothetical protein
MGYDEKRAFFHAVGTFFSMFDDFLCVCLISNYIYKKHHCNCLFMLYLQIVGNNLEFVQSCMILLLFYSARNTKF